MPHNPWEKESELALRAVSSAMDLIPATLEKSAVAFKGRERDVVTFTDLAIEKHLTSVLSPSGLPIVGEEQTSREKPTALPSNPFWLVDPIDGTANFVNQLPMYAISVGLYAGEFVLGAISLPAMQEAFFTLGEVAYLNGTRLQVQKTSLNKSLVTACFSSDPGDPIRRARQYELFGQINDRSRGCLRLGSAATSLCYVAAGRLQAVYGIQNELWDVAAGIAIAVRAGCRVLYVQTGLTKVNYIVAAPGIFEELLRLTSTAPFDELFGFSASRGLVAA